MALLYKGNKLISVLNKVEIVQGGGGADITSNILVSENASDILASEKNKLCILNDTSDLTFKVVIKIEGGVGEFLSLDNIGKLNRQYGCACYVADENKIYVFHGNNFNNNILGSAGIAISTYDLTTKEVTLNIKTIFNDTNPNSYNGLAYSSVFYKDGYFYLLAMYNKYSSGSIYIQSEYLKINREDLSYTIFYTDSGAHKVQATSQLVGNKIYIFGGKSRSNSYSNEPNIKIFDLKTNTYTKTISFVDFLNGYSFLIGDYIYLIGGLKYSDSTVKKSIYRFNTLDDTYETIVEEIPNISNFIHAFQNNNYIYFFDTQTNVYKFDTNTHEIIKVSLTIPFTLNNDILITNTTSFTTYFNNTSPFFYELNLSFELTANNVLIYNSNSKYNFDLITDQVTIPIKNVYIGDSNNTAQLANAYLYDETQEGWVNVNTGEVLTE